MPDWDPLMETGIAAIDDDHRELVRQVNELGLAMRRGEGGRLVAELLAFLGRYAQEHFAVEERLMAEAAYPGLGEHRARHEQFRRDLAAHEASFAAGGEVGTPTLDLHGWVMRWLSAHTLYEDDTFAQFLRERDGS